MFKETRRYPYPTLKGLYQAARVMCRRTETLGAIHTDKLGLTGVCLVFPEFGENFKEIERLIVLGHQVDHLMDEGGGKNNSYSEILRNLNTLYPSFLRSHLHDPRLVKNILGFLSQSLRVEKEIRSLDPEKVDEERLTSYRELINAIWVRMTISFGFGLSGGELDEAGFLIPPYKYSNLESAYDDYIRGLNLSTVPGGKRNHLLFLWTMVIQDTYDELSIRNNFLYETPAMQTNQPYYRQKAIGLGLHPIALTATKASIRAITQLKNPTQR